MSLYETIFTRRSVRQYDQSPLTEAELAEVEAVLNSIKQLPGQTGRFVLVNADQLKGTSAPHAILTHCEDTALAMCNLGYVLASLDLQLQASGLGSIIMGMAKPLKPAPDYRILLAFGKTDVPFRKGESDFKRKPVLEISNEDNAVARAARLAPSAVNFQPWKLNFSQGNVTVQSNGRGIGKLLTGKMQKIDFGIILKYVELALAHEGKTVRSITPKENGRDFSAEVAYGE
ncbi:nitroreductase [Clostridia bacterium]|nr:nitroreductase [Clostridia bacterium]